MNIVQRDTQHHPSRTHRLSALIAATLMLTGLPAMAATFTVDSIFDDGDSNPGDGVCDRVAGGPVSCTLRAAIEQANANGNPGATDYIEFDLPTSSSIALVINIGGTPLPTITQRLVIDGRTATGYNSSATSVADAAPRVYINGSGLGGTTADGFRMNGISLGAIHAIGIIGFPDNGIEVVNGVVDTLDGNWIGIAANGGVDGNDGAGIYLNNCGRCIVGQEIESTAAANIIGVGNRIGDSGEDGIYVLLGDSNVIAGNEVGYGTGNPGNAGHGIHVLGIDNKIGEFRGTGSGDRKTRNIVRNNGGDGIRVETGGQWIYANDIRDNTGNGVSLNGSGSRLGYVAAGMKNFIGRNGGHGVAVGNLFASYGNIVQNNRMHDNSGRGVHIAAGSNNTVKQNYVLDNTGDAVRVDGDSNHVLSNSLGFLLPCSTCTEEVHGNGNNGVVLVGDSNDVTGNRIAEMSDDGIDVVSGDANIISGNQIGMSNDGLDWGNNTGGIFDTGGIRVRNGATNTLVEDNRIGFNNQGIILEGGGTEVCGNRIGVGSGDELAGNVGEGIWLPGGGNLIGDPDSGCSANVIGDNGSDGIQVDSPANIIRGNQIGGVPGINLGNHNGGILLTTANAYLNEIKGNTLVYNSNDGVRVGTTSGTRNRIEQNSFSDNGDLGIDINDDGYTANDVGDMDSGANNIQNHPVITALVGGVGELSVTYRVDTNTVRAAYPLSVDFYLNGGGTNQGRTFIQSDVYAESVTPPATNYEKTITVTLPAGVSTGGLTSMVIDSDGSSSEFSPPLGFTAVPPSTDIFKDGFED
ncbi:MAG: right-handed parallel beta-helix repeat-containing protein [Xanthomonadales bacterium]|nr:right-handed parallel beta-helix repeat-containing protein [Xanthomonadales bacterium]